ncbi:MAG: hypothetical protein N0A16_08055 [Blastocatellia bacterium]|nr:hypothetical protein [Blastocatellia bacterium]MCS7157668.1 hypothetical protein [Blastocatellia bacterium]MCX7751933.1 hypothetical protein [Blastocatellia bacterium]MDW8167039.1 hypothetical protein [Acidobacteriota bacterium]MDW8257143.1 hypothetical protein [Acidobacteriota bacterium]
MKGDSRQRVLGLLLVFIAGMPWRWSVRGERTEELWLLTDRAVLVSDDRGQTWKGVSLGNGRRRLHALRKRASEGAWVATSDGLFRIAMVGRRAERLLWEETFSIAESQGRLFAGTRRGLLVSDDGGRRWQRISALPDGLVPIAIEVAPSHPEVIYIGTVRHGVYRSDDGGRSWKSASVGLPPAIGAAPYTPVRQLVVHPSDSRTAYLGSEAHGVYKTTDGGETWHPVNVGLSWRSAYPTLPPLLAINPEDPEIVYALIRRRLDSARVENALYKSATGGQFWRELTGLSAHHIFRGLTIDPRQPRRLLLTHTEGVIEVFDHPAWDVFFKTPAPEIRALDVSRATASRSLVEIVGQISVMTADREVFHEFDLDRRSLQFTPVFDTRRRFLGYDVSFVPLAFILEGERVRIEDEGFLERSLPFAFSFYGQTFTSVFLNANGNLTFGSPDPDPTPTELEFVTKQPRIAPLWLDLAPSRGTVLIWEEFDRVVITWRDVPEVPEVEIAEALLPRNTFQVALFRDGRILFSYNGVESVRGLVGISSGNRQAFWRVKFTADISADPLRPTSFRPPWRQGDLPIGELFRAGLLLREVARRFFTRHPDAFDLLIIYGASTFERLTITGRVVQRGAFTLPVAAWVKNEIEGLGLPIFDDAATFGSAGRLRLVVNMDLLRSYPADPLEEFLGTKSAMDILAQMVGHAWGAYVRFDDGGVSSDALLAGTERFTWSFFLDTDASELDGHDWEILSGNRFRSVAANERYSPLDQYLMGLRPPEEVPPFFLIENPTETEGRTRGSPPELEVVVRGSARTITLTDILRVEGPRRPAYVEAPKVFRAAFILIVPEGFPVTAIDLNKVELFRRTFELFFKQATEGRGRLETEVIF